MGFLMMIFALHEAGCVSKIHPGPPRSQLRGSFSLLAVKGKWYGSQVPISRKAAPVGIPKNKN